MNTFVYKLLYFAQTIFLSSLNLIIFTSFMTLPFTFFADLVDIRLGATVDNTAVALKHENNNYVAEKLLKCPQWTWLF